MSLSGNGNRCWTIFSRSGSKEYCNYLIVILRGPESANGYNDHNECITVSGKWRNNFLDYTARYQEKRIHCRIDDF